MRFDVAEKLAIAGGPKAKRTPFPKGTRHGELEKRYLNEVIDSDMLFFYMGTKVRALEKRFAEMYGMKHCIACSSGTTAVHMAVAALQLSVGSEVFTSAITDMGSLTGVLYQGLVPVFADVDPETLNVTPEKVRRTITPKTGAIMVVHHAGLASDMDGFWALSRETGIPLIEDCAQSYCCRYKGRLAGTMGAINSFSLNHFKHITCGSGGMILTNDDALRYHSSLFLDKDATSATRGSGTRSWPAAGRPAGRLLELDAVPAEQRRRQPGGHAARVGCRCFLAVPSPAVRRLPPFFPLDWPSRAPASCA